jgi:hypothetical protein
LTSSGLPAPAQTWRDRAPVLVLAAAICAAVAYLVGYFADYSHWFIHPHQFEVHLPMLLSDGPEFHLRNFGKIFQLFDPSENRPRFLTYAVILLNLHLRMWLYEWFVLFPPFSVGWVFELLLGPFLLYRLIMNLTGVRAAALTGLLVYLTSVGFLSGFGMPLAPGKPLTNVVFITVLYLCSEVKKRAAPGRLFLEVPGCRGMRSAIFMILLGGLFLDEVPLFAFALPPLFFPELFWIPGRNLATFKRQLLNWVAFASPGIVFGVLVVGVVPRITQALYQYRFDFLSSVFVNKAAREAGKTFLSGAQYGFGVESLSANFVSLFGTAVVPWQIAPLTTYPGGAGSTITGLHTGIAAVSAVVAFVMVMAVLTRAAGDSRRALLVRAFFAAALFVLFMSLLTGRHAPHISGYVYGCAFAVLLAILISAAVPIASAGGALRRWIVVVAACYVSIVQIDDFEAINRNWISVHNDGWIRNAYKESLPLAGDRALTRRELDAIWTAWKNGRLDAYLASNRISSSAVFLVFELRSLDRTRRGPSVGLESHLPRDVPM